MQVLTSSRSSAGAAGLWRYVVRAAVVARLDKLRATLREEDARADDAATEAARRLQRQQQLGLSAFTSAGIGRSRRPALVFTVCRPVCHNSTDPGLYSTQLLLPRLQRHQTHGSWPSCVFGTLYIRNRRQWWAQLCCLRRIR